MVTDYVSALLQARVSGMPVSLGGSGLTVNPDGSVGTPGGGYRTPSPAPLTQPALNQANPAMTAGIAGQPGSPSGNVAAGAPTPAPSNPALAAQAAAYRGGGTPSVTLAPQTVTAQAPTQGLGLTTDQLNQMSLQAAQQGRTFWNPNLNVQPGGNVLNALTLPPNAGANALYQGVAQNPAAATQFASAAPVGFTQQNLPVPTRWQQQQNPALLYGGGGAP